MEHDGWVSDACTLPTARQPVRVAEFDQFFAAAVRRLRRPERTRLELVVDPVHETRARELAALETACCSFFAFGFDSTADGVNMRIEVPANRIDVLDGLHRNVAAALAERERT
ncbi:hypothetical protein [Nocardia goodfellowii]|uniref:Arsenate reductase n=1 Tax=Nocardia goodfellowii TaxID=882446 RepID=A0ABS4QBQ9_9NOCA|nr:hypothetical protein [Nocardia goodfellowii]MBP2189141.1 hypothetical protein [Nocardia goodfellowii]